MFEVRQIISVFSKMRLEKKSLGTTVLHERPLFHCMKQFLRERPGPALADAGPNARPKRGAPLSSNFMTSWCSVSRVTIVVERKYAVQH